MLARNARVLLVAEEVTELCGLPPFATDLKSSTPTWFRHYPPGNNRSAVVEEYREACRDVDFPSDESIRDAITTLRESVQVWIDGTAVTPFVYDSDWGGVVSCGCDFDGKVCKNKLPNCLGFDDPGLNFGNGTCERH
jgi:hypothetical protein